jgi:hypothetical protein
LPIVFLFVTLINNFHFSVVSPLTISSNQDLIRLLIFDQDNIPVALTRFTIIHDDDTTPDAPFGLRTEDGKGVVFTTRALDQKQSYQLKIEGIAYDQTTRAVPYHTTFMIYLSVSSYPY